MNAMAESFAASQMLAESAKTAETIQKPFSVPQWSHIDSIVSYDDEEPTEDSSEKEVEGEKEE